MGILGSEVVVIMIGGLNNMKMLQLITEKQAN